MSDILSGMQFGMQMSQQGAALGKQNKLNRLTRQAYQAGPMGRDQYVAEAMGADADAGMALNKGLQVDDATRSQRLAVMAKALTEAPEQMRPALYKQMIPELSRFGLSTLPTEYTPEVAQTAQQIAQAFSGMGTGGRVHSQKIGADGFIYNTMMDGSVVNTGVKADRQMWFRDHPGMSPELVGKDGSIQPVGAQARPSEATVAAQEAEARARVESQYAPMTAAATENAKIGAQVANAPALAQAEANRTAAVEGAKAGVERAGQQRGKDEAYAVYQQGMAGLVSGLSGADTGPIVGRLPAVTTNQQIAQGGVDAMGPILKQLFRSAGEGAFTDRDQAMLMGMLPTRTDTPAARKAKLRNIDNIVKAKLGMGGAKPARTVVRRGTHNGKRVVQYSDGSIEYGN